MASDPGHQLKRVKLFLIPFITISGLVSFVRNMNQIKMSENTATLGGRNTRFENTQVL